MWEYTSRHWDVAQADFLRAWISVDLDAAWIWKSMDLRTPELYAWTHPFAIWFWVSYIFFSCVQNSTFLTLVVLSNQVCVRYHNLWCRDLRMRPHESYIYCSNSQQRGGLTGDGSINRKQSPLHGARSVGRRSWLWPPWERVARRFQLKIMKT